jgi:hypothetical protein
VAKKRVTPPSIDKLDTLTLPDLRQNVRHLDALLDDTRRPVTSQVLLAEMLNTRNRLSAEIARRERAAKKRGKS